MPPMTNQLTDEQIVSLVQKGEVEPFGLLLQRYEAKIKRYAKKFLFNYDDIEDLVQEIFLKTYTNIQSFDPDRKFSSWLYRIAHNEFINAIKKRGREPLTFFDADILFPHPVAKEKTDTEIIQNDLRQMIDTCMDKLKTKYREPLILYYFEELSYKEIADVLHIPVATVGIRIKRGKKSMKEILNQLDPHYGSQ